MNNNKPYISTLKLIQKMESDIKTTKSVIEKEEYSKDVPIEVFKELNKVLEDVLFKLDAAKDATRLVLKFDSIKNIAKLLNILDKDDADINTLINQLDDLKKI